MPILRLKPLSAFLSDLPPFLAHLPIYSHFDLLERTTAACFFWEKGKIT